MKKLKVSYNSPIMLSFVLISLVVTVLGYITNDISTSILFSTYRSSLSDPLTYIRLVTHIFGHNGFEHFIGNAMYLLMLGPVLEEKYGSDKMFKLILITALITGTLHCLLFKGVALCGASGVVFACILLSSLTNFKTGEIPVSFLLVVIIYIGKEIFSGIMINDNISNFTHIIGGFVGGIYGYILNNKRNT